MSFSKVEFSEGNNAASKTTNKVSILILVGVGYVSMLVNVLNTIVPFYFVPFHLDAIMELVR